jgi:phospholipase C
MIRKNLRWMAAVAVATNLAIVTPSGLTAGQGDAHTRDADTFRTDTPIKYVVVIFQENVSFDHYFGTYPNATNPSGEPAFHPKSGTPNVNGLSDALLLHNPNSANPIRLDRSQAHTCDQNHDYMPEQQAFDGGLMDKFLEFVTVACTGSSFPQSVDNLGKAVIMGYYDGNTVTALWNYAQYFSLNQNFYGTTFGPSTPGVLNLVSGQTHGVDPSANIGTGGDVIADSVVGDPDPFYDDCSGSEQVGMLKTNKNVGDLLNEKHITWGWFQGGFGPTGTSNGKAVCGLSTNRLDGVSVAAYSAHHEPFQYYASTSNPHHTAPASIAEIGHNGPANHQYDLTDFWNAAFSGHLPAVSFLKATRAQDGHASNSTPLDEQAFLVDALNKLQSLEEWENTAVLITWDDSDGWYDHQLGNIINGSKTTEDAFSGTGVCGSGASALAGFQGRCGYGPRLPLLVISPYAKENFVDSTLSDQSSILRFIENNWDVGRIGNGSYDEIAGRLTNMFDFEHKRRERVFLDTSTGLVIAVENQ